MRSCKFNFLVKGVVLVIFIFMPFSFSKIVLALNNNYGKVDGNSITMNEWNSLYNDFLPWESGGVVMLNDLDMGGFSIQNILEPEDSELNNVVNVKYTNEVLLSRSGIGEDFVNWGRRDCPDGSLLLYRGYSFGPRMTANQGVPTNISCYQSDFPSVSNGTLEGTLSKMYPMALERVGGLPTDSGFDGNAKKAVGCAKCYNYSGECYVSWYSDECASGYNHGYKGWAFGGRTDYHMYQTDAYCVNSDFDSNLPTLGIEIGFLTAITLENSDGIPSSSYSSGVPVKCAVCCR